MNISTWLKNTQGILQANNINTARLDALVLLEHTTKNDRSWLLAHDDSIITKSQLQELEQAIAERLRGIPLAYIIGNKEFYGRGFNVAPEVLVPRPESESFIEILKTLSPQRGSLLDIGTGSGILAITAKKEFPGLEVCASDVSKPALAIAKQNAMNHAADINFVQSDLLQSVRGSFDYICANLPYVPTTLEVSTEVLSEPRLAVFSGPDGLDCIREFLRTSPKHINNGGYILIESLISQHSQVTELAVAVGFQLLQTNGLVQLYQKV